MTFDTPRNHPTFLRALGQWQRALRSDPLPPAPIHPESLNAAELAERSLADLTSSAFELAIDSLYQSAPLQGSLSYSISGEQFARDGIVQIQQSQPDPVLALFERSLRSSLGSLPRMIHTRIDFGLYEDGLLFGASSSECEGGDFSTLTALIERGLDQAALSRTLAKLQEDGVPACLARALAEELADELKPSMRALALRSFPLGLGLNAKPVCSLAEDLARRADMLEEGVFYIDHQGGLMPGASAAQAIRLASERVAKALPLAGALSRFKMQLGV